MKNKTAARMTVCALTLTLLFTAVACQAEPEEETPIANPIEITISIDYPDQSGQKDIEDVQFKIEENSTVLDAIQLYCNVNEISLTVDTTDASVQGINGVENGDYAAKKTWQYKINGRLCSDGENEKKLEDGDQLQWVYRK